MNAAELRRKDTTKGPPLRILSLDGGGVRGYSMLILLQELMHRTHVEVHGQAPRPQDIPKPCDHFDLIAGTGTGGLIAIMLGRLRLDLETCKDVYIRMTKRVFETDKTFAGIPYRSTLFKASKLEEAIRDCVKEHTIFDDEGNDTLANATPMTPDTPASGMTPSFSAAPSRSMSSASRMSIGGGPAPYSPGRAVGAGRWGNPNALLYDVREHRTKTAVTAVYQGSRKGDKAVLLRSYDSRREPAPEVNCTIWQAGRATAATGLAFKPIQIGQSVFIDEGPGRYNPSPQVLDEAMINEYPTRDVGVFVSIGTGKRPPNTQQQQSEWWEDFLGGSAGAFAEARRRLIGKIEGCEETHQYMQREHLGLRGVNAENYYRLNVEVGVGEFGMNEWSRLSDISTNTRRYLAKENVQSMNLSAASKIARIHRAKVRWERANGISPPGSRPYSFEEQRDGEIHLPHDPMAIELPAEVPANYPQAPVYPPQQQQQQPHPYPLHNLSAQQHQQQTSNSTSNPTPTSNPIQPQPPNPQFHQQLQRPSYDEKIPIVSDNTLGNPEDRILPQNYAITPTAYANSPPPLPPKTPLGHRNREGQYLHRPPDTRTPQGRSPRVSSDQFTPPHGGGTYTVSGAASPYPDPDGPPPSVDMGSKPQYGIRYAQ